MLRGNGIMRGIGRGLGKARGYIFWYKAKSLEVDSYLPNLITEPRNNRYAVNGVEKTFGEVHTFRRNTTATYNDFEGLIKTAGFDEPRHQGMWVVANLLVSPTDFSDPAWIDEFSGVVSQDEINWIAGTAGTNRIRQSAIYVSGERNGHTSIASVTVPPASFFSDPDVVFSILFADDGTIVTFSPTPAEQIVTVTGAHTTTGSSTNFMFFADRVCTQTKRFKCLVETTTGQSNQNPSSFDFSIGNELVSNGTFDTSDGWVVETAGWSISGGVITCDGSAGALSKIAPIERLQNFKSYKVTYTISGMTTGEVRILLYADNYRALGTNRVANGTYTEILSINGSTGTPLQAIRLQNVVGAFDGSIDNITVKKLADDVQVSIYENGNTVSGDVMSEAQGALIPYATRKGVGNEYVATNINPYSEATVANWGGTSGTYTDLVGGYLGVFNGVRAASGGADWHRLGGRLHAVTNGVTYSIMVWVIKGTSGRARLVFRLNSIESRITGAFGSESVTSTAAGALTLVEATEQTVNGEDYVIYECSYTANFTGNLTVDIGPDSFVTGEDIIALGAQTETSPRSTSYIPTAGAAVTRGADVCKIDGAVFASFWNASVGTLYIEQEVFFQNNWSGLISANDGTGSNLIELQQSNFGSVWQYIVDAGVVQFNAGLGASIIGVSNKEALTYELNNSVGASGGTVGTTDAACTIPTATQLDIMNKYGFSQSNGYYQGARNYPIRALNASIGVLTT